MIIGSFEASALIAVIGGDAVHDMGYLYVLVPTGLGVLVMLIVALLINNISKNRRYPEAGFVTPYSGGSAPASHRLPSEAL